MRSDQNHAQEMLCSGPIQTGVLVGKARGGKGTGHERVTCQLFCKAPPQTGVLIGKTEGPRMSEKLDDAIYSWNAFPWAMFEPLARCS